MNISNIVFYYNCSSRVELIMLSWLKLALGQTEQKYLVAVSSMINMINHECIN
jgi:hypothetical protein